MNKHFIFIRHGESEWSPDRICEGFLDLPLTSKGKIQADECGGYLSDFSITTVYTSPLLRAVDTTNIINSYTNINLKTIPDLEEYRYHDSNENETSFTQRVSSVIHTLLENDNNFIIVSHSRVFKSLTELLCKKSMIIHYASAYEFLYINNEWICRCLFVPDTPNLSECIKIV